MKRISKYFLCLFAVVLTAGCAEDKLGETEFDPTVYEGDKAYMTVQVTMPSVPGSRSNTVEGARKCAIIWYRKSVSGRGEIPHRR